MHAWAGAPLRVCTWVSCVCLHAHSWVSVGTEACTHVCTYERVNVCTCVCVSTYSVDCMVAYSCLVYEDRGPRGLVSLCFPGLVILLSGLGGHAEDLLAVCIKMFIGSLSGLALQTSFHGLPASQALRLTFGAGGVWSGSSVGCS